MSPETEQEPAQGETQASKEDPRTAHARAALMGWSDETFAALRQADRRFLAVVPPEFGAYMEEHGIPYEPFDFQRSDEKGHDLAERLRARGVEFTVPLYEETVEWAGAVEATLRGDPRIYRRALLFRDKASMKRMAQMAGLKVGVFEEVGDRREVSRFLRRVNNALAKIDEDDPDPVHLKPFTAAGAVGHRIIRTERDILEIPDDEFPLLAESNLNGQEFSCEAFIHDGRIKFLNITEYVHLGHSDFVPASPELEQHRPKVEEAIETLIEAFGYRNGVLHPEFFVDHKGDLKFGEVGARIPGGNIFHSIRDAYGFDPYLAYVLCSDPETPEEELDAFFPTPVEGAKGHAGVLLVYPPEGHHVSELNVPEEIMEDPDFERHTLMPPIPGKVAPRDGFGGFWGCIYFMSDDPTALREKLLRYEKLDFYT